MSDALVKLTIDLYAPDAVLTTREYEWLKKWDQFPTRRVIFPVEPMEYLSKITDPITIGRTVVKDFCHLRITAIDDQYEGLMDSELDRLLTNTRLDRFLGDDLFIIAHEALMRVKFNEQFRAHAAWCEAWVYDDVLVYRKELSIYSVMNIALDRPG